MLLYSAASRIESSILRSIVYNYEENGVWLLINNYRILEESQFWTVNQWDKCMRAMSDAVMRERPTRKILTVPNEKVDVCMFAVVN